MRKEILKYLACPINHDELIMQHDKNLEPDDICQNKLISSKGIEYTIDNGIPNLIPFVKARGETAYLRITKPYDQIILESGLSSDWISRMDILRYSINKLIDISIKNNLTGVVLEIGAGGNYLKSKYINYSKEWISSDYDLRSGSIDILADGQNLPIKNNTIDTIISIDVLEHIPEPEKVVKEIYRVLKPGGIIILSTPFFFWHHEEPNDFFRFSRYGLRYIFEKNKFTVLSIKPIAGAISLIGILISILITKGFKFSFILMKLILRINKFMQLLILMPMDKFFDKRKRLAQGHFIIARKN